jgi:hypothetical protein
MKKSIALVALAFGVSSAFAQDLTSKKGEPILPEADDWSVGIEAAPFLTYAQSIFGKSAGTLSPTWNFFTTNNSITVKQMKDAQNAYRASFRLGFGGTTTKNMVNDRSYVVPTGSTGYADQLPQVENKWKQSNTNIGISVGMEKRRGKTRLQGFYGAEVGFNISTTRNKFTYGNTLAPTATAPAVVVDVTSADEFNPSINNVQNASGLGIQNPVSGSDARMIDMKSGMSLSFGVRAFIGAEYFILPKMSLGGEFGWGLGYTMTGASKTVWETTGNTTVTNPISGNTSNTTATTEIKGNKSSSWSFDTDRNSLWGASASLKLNMYF